MFKLIKESYFQIQASYIANHLLSQNFSYRKELSDDFWFYLNPNHKLLNDFTQLKVEALKYLATQANTDKVDKQNHTLLEQYVSPKIDELTFKQALNNSKNPNPQISVDLLITFFNTHRNFAEITPEYEQQKNKLILLINHKNFDMNNVFHSFKGQYTFLEDLVVHCFNYPNVPTHEKLFSDLSETRLKEIMTLDNLSIAYQKWIDLFNNKKIDSSTEALYQKILPIMEKQGLEKMLTEKPQNTKNKKVKI
jgi:hypothetical protein